MFFVRRKLTLVDRNMERCLGVEAWRIFSFGDLFPRNLRPPTTSVVYVKTASHFLKLVSKTRWIYRWILHYDKLTITPRQIFGKFSELELEFFRMLTRDFWAGRFNSMCKVASAVTCMAESIQTLCCSRSRQENGEKRIHLGPRSRCDASSCTWPLLSSNSAQRSSHGFHSSGNFYSRYGHDLDMCRQPRCV